MCLACVTRAVVLVENIIPGYFLEIATQDAAVGPEEWPKGYLGLVHMNGPDYVWKYEPLVDPTYDMSDDEVEALAKDDPKNKECEAFCDYLNREVFDSFYHTPFHGHRFYEACMAAGYDPKTHGSNILYWFIQMVNTRLAQLDMREEHLAEVAKREYAEMEQALKLNNPQ